MIRKMSSFFTSVMKNYLPDAYLFAIILTFITIILSFIFTDAGICSIVMKWGNGLYSIMAFAMQMILILVTGYVLALSPPFKKVLDKIAGSITNPVAGVMTVVLVNGIGSWINWGFGLILSGLLAVEIARRNRRADFPILIAAAYSGFVVWHMGLSGSIPLLAATADHPQNLIEQATGSIAPVADTIFATWNLLPAIIIVFSLPFLFMMMYPRKEDTAVISEEKLAQIHEEKAAEPRPANPTPAERIDHSYIINYLFAALGLAYLSSHFYIKGLDLNLNIVICIFFIAGIILHGRPADYIKSINIAIKATGGIALQFPLYGGIMGIMAGTGLAGIIAGWFVSISNQNTYYIFQFFSGGIINLFVPSGGGQWAVQGPIAVQAANTLSIDLARASMMVAWGDQWTNMIQPFWALPLLGLAGLSAKDIMGYTAMTFLWSGIVLGGFALLIGFGVI